MSLEVRSVGVFVPLEARSLENHLQNTVHVAVKHLLVELSLLYALKNLGVLLRTSRLQHVVACLHLSHGILTAKPVGHHHPLVAPLIAQGNGLQLLAFTGVRTIQIIV